MKTRKEFVNKSTTSKPKKSSTSAIGYFIPDLEKRLSLAGGGHVAPKLVTIVDESSPKGHWISERDL